MNSKIIEKQFKYKEYFNQNFEWINSKNYWEQLNDKWFVETFESKFNWFDIAAKYLMYKENLPNWFLKKYQSKMYKEWNSINEIG